MNFKRILAIGAAIAALSTSAVFAEDTAVATDTNEITVKVNGEKIAFPDQKPVILNQRTLVPLRGVFDSLHFTVTWDDATRSAKISNSLKDITITENNNKIISNTKTIETDVAPQIINGRLMIPLRAVAESADVQVEWDSATKTVNIYYYYADGVDESVKNVGLDEQQYIKTIISLKEEMRAITDTMPDAVLYYSANLGNFKTAKEFKVEDAQYEALEEVLSKIEDLEPPESLFALKEDLKDYVTAIRELVSYSREKNPKNILDTGNDAFMTPLDDYKFRIEEINSRFGNDIIQYFTENKVYWEEIYGESTILNFLLY